MRNNQNSQESNIIENKIVKRSNRELYIYVAGLLTGVALVVGIMVVSKAYFSYPTVVTNMDDIGFVWKGRRIATVKAPQSDGTTILIERNHIHDITFRIKKEFD